MYSEERYQMERFFISPVALDFSAADGTIVFTFEPYQLMGHSLKVYEVGLIYSEEATDGFTVGAGQIGVMSFYYTIGGSSSEKTITVEASKALGYTKEQGMVSAGTTLTFNDGDLADFRVKLQHNPLGGGSNVGQGRLFIRYRQAVIDA